MGGSCLVAGRLWLLCKTGLEPSWRLGYPPDRGVTGFLTSQVKSV